MVENIIARGAEAILLQENGKLIKRRIKKNYRLKEIDEKLRKSRTRREVRLLEKSSKLINAPKIFNVDEIDKEIVMEFVNGKRLSDHLDSFPKDKAKSLCIEIGKAIAKLHDIDIIHGDLTTSNMILEKTSDKTFLIDFGLGFQSARVEDKAVDLHLLRQALEAKHFRNWQVLFNSVINGYKQSENAEKVLEQLKKVEKRGRYK